MPHKKKHKPNHLHLLACYTLYRMKQELASGNKLDQQFNHPVLFEKILFIVGDAVMSAGHLDLGLQTTFQSPPTTGGGWDVRLATVMTVLEQCIEQEWMEKPSSPDGNIFNYELLAKGETIIEPLLKNKGYTIRLGGTDVVILKKATLKIVDKVVKRWVGEDPEKIAHKIPEIVRNAHLLETSVPHYDFLHDKWMGPFLEGVERSQE
ncbi:MAG: hypothetical protein GY862_03835 [Gammaproteobacteria bacterium]|nr:hypothetical protein [Gammaproteobacteria bacterium]